MHGHWEFEFADIDSMQYTVRIQGAIHAELVQGDFILNIPGQGVEAGIYPADNIVRAWPFVFAGNDYGKNIKQYKGNFCFQSFMNSTFRS